jgi:ketosteroid isomerase-like protein
MYYAPFEESSMADNAAIIRGIYEALARGEIAAVLGALHEHAEWNEAEHFTYWPGHAFIGPQAVLAGVIARIPQDLDGFAIDIRRIVAAGDTVLVEARYRGTAKATGKPVDAQVAHVWDLRDGQVVRFQQYTDTWQFAQATGVAPLEKALA